MLLVDSDSSDGVPQTLVWPGASAALITVVATVVGTALPKLLWPPDYKSDAEKSALQPECQALRTVKNKTPGVQLRPKNCKWACTKILKKYTRRVSLFLKLHSCTAAALKVFPN